VDPSLLPRNTKSVTLIRSAAQPRWCGQSKRACSLPAYSEEDLGVSGGRLPCRHLSFTKTARGPLSERALVRKGPLSGRVWRHPIRHTSPDTFCKDEVQATVNRHPKSVADMSRRHQIRRKRQRLTPNPSHLCRTPNLSHQTPNLSRLAPNPSHSDTKSVTIDPKSVVRTAPPAPNPS